MSPLNFDEKAIKADALKYDGCFITLMEMCVLLVNILKCLETERDIGWNHATKTFSDFYKVLSVRRWVSITTLESCLYCCNLLDERGKFWYPKNEVRFNRFLEKVSPQKMKFNKRYNYFEPIKEEKNGKKKRTAKS